MEWYLTRWAEILVGRQSILMITAPKIPSIGGLHMTLSETWLCKLLSICPNFDMAYKTIPHVSVPNLKLFGSMEMELWAKEVEEFSITLYGKMDWWGCCNINVQRFSKLWTAVTLAFIGISSWNLQRYTYFKMGLFTLYNFIFGSNSWWRHCKPRIQWF